jgi:putative transcriptional regulator
MSLSKLCFLATLVVVAAFAAMAGFNVHTKQVDVLTPNGRSYYPAVAHDEPLFLPVQSQNPGDLGAGKVLVASRALADPNFAETVILLVRCDAEGAVGLILNRPTNIPLSRVLEQFAAAKDRSDPAYHGGPVEASAVFGLLRSTAKLDGAEQVFSGVYLIAKKTVFEKAISDRPDAGTFHAYLGYAGWSNEQLRREVKLGSWFIFQGDARTVFDSDPDSLWRQMIQKTEFELAHNDPHALAPFGVTERVSAPLWLRSRRHRQTITLRYDPA